MSDPKRFHPYSQNAQKMGRLSLSKNALKTSSSKRTPLSVLNTYANDPVYEHKSYLNQKNVYPTMIKSNQAKKGVLKSTRSVNDLSDGSAQSDQKDSGDLRLLSATTESAQVIAKNFSEAKNSGPYLFEMIAQLDSTVSEASARGAREFSIKDKHGRIQCIFYEIDRGLERLVRDAWLRCIGKFDSKKRLFQCVSVRLVKSESELLAFGFRVNTTNSYLNYKFVKS